MTKKLICLLLALVMMLSLCMTSCSSGEEESEGETKEEEAQRGNIALTIYAITNQSTTEEGLKAVEEKISNYCVAKFKTAIDLRFYTEAQYKAALDDMYAKFAEEEAKAEEAKKKAAEEAKKEQAYKATLSVEERRKYEQEKRLAAKKAEEEAKKKAEEEAELIEQGKDVAVVADVQMDLLFIPGMNEYYENVADELLVDLTSYLTGKYKKIKDYVYPSFITAATTDKGIFGIPNNQAISTKETFFVVNSALAEKYQVDWTKVRSITDLNDVFAQVKAGEPGVTPIYGDFAAEGLSVYTGVDNGGSICVFHDDLLGGKFTGETTNATYNPATTASQAYIEYCAAKAAYRQNEYISDTNENFFLSVQELTEEERAAWEAKGYTTILYKGADFTTEAALENGLFGLSKYCKQPERAMEILQLLTTDADFRNLLAFGVEEVNYVKTAGEHDNVITIVNNNYSMDFNKTGNALLGYVTDQMDPNYAEYAKQKNLNSRLNPFLGFYYDWSTDANKDYVKALGEWAAAVKDKVEQLNYGVENYNEILTTMYDELRNDPTKKFTENYANWQNNCSFRSNYKTYATKLVALDEALHFAAEAITPIGSAN